MRWDGLHVSVHSLHLLRPPPPHNPTSMSKYNWAPAYDDALLSFPGHNVLSWSEARVPQQQQFIKVHFKFWFLHAMIGKLKLSIFNTSLSLDLCERAGRILSETKYDFVLHFLNRWKNYWQAQGHSGMKP